MFDQTEIAFVLRHKLILPKINMSNVETNTMII